MKILHFGKYYPPDTGGIESVTYSVAHGAKKNGHSVAVICFSKEPNLHKDDEHDIKIFRCKTRFKLFSQPLSLKYIILCLKESKNYQVVHIHAPNYLAAFATLFLKNKVKVIVHWHSDVLNKPLSKILWVFQYFMLKRANFIISTSRVYAISSRQLKNFRNKICIVPIGVEEPKTLSSLKDLPNHLNNIIFNKKIILSVGRLVPYKGFDVLIRSAKYLTSDKIVLIIGQGPEEIKLRKIISLENLSDKVYIIGNVDKQQLDFLYRISDIFCLSSLTRAEAFGVVLVEALSYGLPIVSTSICGSGVGWVNRHNVTGLKVPIGNTKLLADAINSILDNEDLYKKFSSAGKIRFLKIFTEQSSINKILKIYNNI